MYVKVYINVFSPNLGFKYRVFFFTGKSSKYKKVNLGEVWCIYVLRFDTYAICFKRPNHCSAIALPAFSSFHRVFARRPIFHRLTSVACPMFEWLLRREMRQARGQFASYHSITLPHYHCSTVSRYHSSTVPLYHSTTEALYHRTTVSFTTVSL